MLAWSIFSRKIGFALMFKRTRLKLFLCYVFFFPLLLFKVAASAEEAADIFSIEDKVLTDLREPYAQRPRPADLVFNEKAMEKYLASLPENLREAEKRRYDIIKGAKDQIIRLFERNTMDIKESIKLKSGRSVSGTIALANEEVFIIRKGKSGKGKSYKWDDLSFNGYAEILDQFAQKRMKVKVANVSAEESRKYAANDYILLTLLSDWYGDYRLCKEFANKAVDLRPDIKDQLNELIFK